MFKDIHTFLALDYRDALLMILIIVYHTKKLLSKS